MSGFCPLLDVCIRGALGSFPFPSLFRFLVPNKPTYSCTYLGCGLLYFEVMTWVGSNIRSCAFTELITFPCACVINGVLCAACAPDLDVSLYCPRESSRYNWFPSVQQRRVAVFLSAVEAFWFNSLCTDTSDRPFGDTDSSKRKLSKSKRKREHQYYIA